MIVPTTVIAGAVIFMICFIIATVKSVRHSRFGLGSIIMIVLGVMLLAVIYVEVG